MCEADKQLHFQLQFGFKLGVAVKEIDVEIGREALGPFTWTFQLGSPILPFSRARLIIHDGATPPGLVRAMPSRRITLSIS